MKTKFVLLGMAFMFFSCGSNNQKHGTVLGKADETTVKDENTAISASKINTDSLIKVIDAEREKIESNLKTLQRKSVSTKDLRAQIKQKWSKIDFYKDQAQIVRMKTYPYEKISQRTEEFYIRNGKLMLAFIEDNGSVSIGKSEKRVGKTYYFFNDSLIKEDNATSEQETTIRNSDAERLLQEAKEYLELYPK